MPRSLTFLKDFAILNLENNNLEFWEVLYELQINTNIQVRTDEPFDFTPF